MSTKQNKIRKRRPEESEITKEGEMPKKCFYRSRAHVNPLSHNDAFEYPVGPDDIDWRTLYPRMSGSKELPTIVDVGCGFGGLTVALADLFPDDYSLGVEIRAKVTEYVRLRILALRVWASLDAHLDEL